MQGRESVRTLSVQRPQPYTTNPWKEEKDKTVANAFQQESIGSALVIQHFSKSLCTLTYIPPPVAFDIYQTLLAGA